MKKHFCVLAALLLALSLPLSSCGDVGIISGDDGPEGIYIGDNTITIGDAEDKTADPATPNSTPAPEAPSPEVPSVTTDGTEEPPYEDPQLPEEEEAYLDEDGTYNSAEDVSLYLYTYDHLPSNYITKSEARDLGWTGGSVEKYAPGCAIGGDKFGNREGVLPEGTYHECDIDTIGGDSRGAKRIVYSDDGRIYYTEDHYETFTLLYGEE